MTRLGPTIAVCSTLALSALSHAEPSGFRGDGTGHFPDATIPELGQVAWRVKTNAWSNATPVLFGDMVCILGEPTEVTCLDRTSGTTRWVGQNHYIDTLPASERERMTVELAKFDELSARRLEAARAFAKARRNTRAGGSTEDADAAEQALSEIQAQLDAISPYLTPPNKDLIGYSSPTPLATDTHLYVLGGNGVVSAFRRDGSKEWTRYLGAAPEPMRGFELGTTASLAWAGDLLVVPYGTLQGLDPTTGQTRWTSVPYLDYGPPTVVRVGDTHALATPDGYLIDAKNGQQLASGLGDIWYTSPIYTGNTLVSIGGKAQSGSSEPLQAQAWSLTEDAAGVKVTPSWTTQLDTRSRLYGHPLSDGEHIWIMTIEQEIVVLDVASGEQRWRGKVDKIETQTWAGPVLANGTLLFTTRGGAWITGPAKWPFVAKVAELDDECRAGVVLSGQHAYVRTMSELIAYGP